MRAPAGPARIVQCSKVLATSTSVGSFDVVTSFNPPRVTLELYLGLTVICLRDDGDAEVQHSNIIMRERAGSTAGTDCAMI